MKEKIINHYIAKNLPQGIIISDPSYDQDVWCAYNTSQSFSNFNVRIEAKVDKSIYTADNGEEIEVNENRIQVIFGINQKYCSLITLDGDKLDYPNNTTYKEFKIGVDTAALYFGDKRKFSEIHAFHIGTDGLHIGDVVEIRDKNLIVGLIFSLNIDANMNSLKEVIQLIEYNFNLVSKKNVTHYIAKNLPAGIIISDPSYNKDVWCAYNTDQRFTNFKVRIESEIVTVENPLSIKKTFDKTFNVFNVYFAINKKVYDIIDVDEKGILSRPKNTTYKEFEIGVDSATLYFGDNLIFCEEGALSTGTDGEIGHVIEIRDPHFIVGLIFSFGIDPDICSIDDVTKLLEYNFHLEKL